MNDLIFRNKRNFVFLGEAGSGKSEVAVNLAYYLKENQEMPVHFFDMDMTKPLFRSRDLCDEMEQAGIVFHYEEQFYDAPTMVGGVSRILRDPECFTLLDVGGDHIGARAIGAYAPLLKEDDCYIAYVLNSYRPWSTGIEAIDRTLGLILGASHLGVANLHMIDNSNLGPETTVEESLAGYEKTVRDVSPYMPVEGSCARKEIAAEAAERSGREIFPLTLHLAYPWMINE